MAKTDISPYVTGWDAPVFNGQAQENVHIWISRIRYGLKQRHVPRSLWVTIALHFLGEEPREVLNDVRRTMTQLLDQEGKEEWDWDWETFTSALVRIHERAKKDAEKGSTSIADDFHRFRRKHPYAAAAAGLGLVAAGGVTVGPAMFVGALHMAGLTVSGVFGGSIAVAPVAVQALSAGTMALGAWVGFGDTGNKTAPVDDSLVKTTASVDDSPVETTVPADNNVKNTALVENTGPIDNTSLVDDTSLANSAPPVEHIAPVTDGLVDNTSPVDNASPIENTATVTDSLIDNLSADNTSLAENTATVTEGPDDNTSFVENTSLAKSAAPVIDASPLDNTSAVENIAPVTDNPVDRMEENLRVPGAF
ncbi:hypothetical protein DFH07DRAFT_794799 [Mycena maculata]|uniref:Uncharacterized protein n=1 Tax=Mycena maculata TaxID=230809 RepID=A0AAD7K6K0_9AGAR|nr:hypothetical protein DFH07DRAFT_794799 [Mycena maculata]